MYYFSPFVRLNEGQVPLSLSSVFASLWAARSNYFRVQVSACRVGSCFSDLSEVFTNMFADHTARVHKTCQWQTGLSVWPVGTVDPQNANTRGRPWQLRSSHREKENLLPVCPVESSPFQQRESWECCAACAQPMSTFIRKHKDEE